MITQVECGKQYIFDQNELYSSEERIAQQSIEIGALVLDISQVTIDMADIYRVPRYYEHRRENNAEHSYMLGLLAMEVGYKYYPGLDTGLMTQFALVHDLVELETNDIPTFQADDKTLEAKQAAEHAALEKLSQTLPPYTADMLLWYEEQEQPEARLVRHLDKLLPYAVDINGAGIAMMREDYGVTTTSQLMEQNKKIEKRFQEWFPEKTHTVLHRAHSVLANKFALEFDEV